MKLESFKFQDGKVFWLPEYPERPIKCVWGKMPPELCIIRLCECAKDEVIYNIAVAQSLASAIEVAPEDIIIIKRLIVESVYKNGQVGNATKVITSMWQSENGKVYSAECEMEIKTIFEPLVNELDLQSGKVPVGTQIAIFHKVARLKLI